jgi:hypothetical protein
MVEAGTPRHSVLVQLLSVPLSIAAFVAVYALLLRLLRLVAKPVRPE